MTRSLILPFGVALALVLAGCGGGGGTGPDDNGNNGGDARVILADPSFGTVIQEIFNRKGCAAGACHGSAMEADLDLRSGNSYGSLVDQPSFQTGVNRVIPGDATNSYLVVKLEGRQTVGARMPLGGSPLDNIDITNIKNWIDQGAANN